MIQSIQFDKKVGWTLPKATQWIVAHEYKIKKVDDTGLRFRFRQKVPHRKTHFYRGHKLGKTGITLILEYPIGQEGEGLFSNVKDRIKLFMQGPKKTAANKVQKILDKEDSPIVKMWACKAPVESAVKKVLNWLSMGKMEQKRKELGYDEIWHAYLVVELEDGKRYRMEKNHTVELRVANHNDLQNARQIPVPKGITMRKLMNNASSAHFYQYSAKGNNCQNFVQDVVHKNNLAESEEVKKIVEPQDSAKLVDTLGPLSGIANAVTNLAARGQRIINGDGLALSKNKVGGRPRIYLNDRFITL